MLFKRDFFVSWRGGEDSEVARCVPYLLFLTDFRVTTAQMQSKSAVAPADSPGGRE